MKTEYKTASGKKVTIEIVTKEVIGKDDWMGNVEKDCYRLEISVDGKNYIYQGTATINHKGTDINVINVLGAKIAVPDENWEEVKGLIDTYTAEVSRRIKAELAADQKYYEDHKKIMGE